MDENLVAREQIAAIDGASRQCLSSEFRERFQALVDKMDPLGLWRAKHPELLDRCLRAINEFYCRLLVYMSPEHQQLVTDALFEAFEAHGLVLRKSNDALFFEHPLAAADHLARFRLDAPTLAAALLHDVAEDTTVSVSQIVERFGPEVGKLVDGVTRLQATGKQVSSRASQDEATIESMNKLFQFMTEDVRVVLVKLADRRHNMYTLSALPLSKQEEKAEEVLRVYAPLAYRLGMWDVKSELEELALKVLHPAIYQQMRELMEQRTQSQSVWLEYVCETLLDRLSDSGVEARIEPSPEQVYSLYQETERRGKLPARLPDTIRVVVLVDKRCDCYRALCTVHTMWNPVPGTFDDYIAHPRENLYQSLHTTVFGPGGRLLKVRFRTFEMHEIAHHGILARWSANISDTARGFEALQRLMKRLRPVRDIAGRGDRLDAYREALQDQIQVFTPEGELIELPTGSTPIDFAYQIHTKLGDEAVAAFINGTERPLSRRLKSGDQVSIEREPGRLPRREWLDDELGFAQTMYARTKIRQAFRRLSDDDAVEIGREALRREMEMAGVPDYDLTALAEAMDYESTDALLTSIARAEVMPFEVAHYALRPVWEALPTRPVGGQAISSNGAVVVRGLPGQPVRMCGSCQPEPGDAIVGNLLRGGQVTVHRLDCHHIDVARQSGDELNLVEVDWVHEPRTVREIHLRVAAEDRSGLTYGLSQIMENEDINISELYGRGERDHQVGLLAATLEVSDLRQLSRILHRLAQMPGVRAVQRMAIPPRLADDSLEWAIAQVDDGRNP